MSGLSFPRQIIKQKCKTCGNESKIIHHVGDPIILFDLYCIKCLEKFLDENVGKLEVLEGE